MQKGKLIASVDGLVKLWLLCTLAIKTHAMEYYDICKQRDIHVVAGKIRVGSGATENHTGYGSNLDCSLVVHSPPGWRIYVRFIRRELMKTEDYIRIYDGGYLASHVPKASVHDSWPCGLKCPETKPSVRTSGNALLLRFTTSSVSRPLDRSFILEIYASPPSPRCKCPAVANGQMSCNFYSQWHDNRYKKCQITCQPGRSMVDNGMFSFLKGKTECNVDEGRWNYGNHKLEDMVYCQNTSDPTAAEVKYSFYYANTSCQVINVSSDSLRSKFELMIKHNSSLPQNGVCFSDSLKGNCSVERLGFACSQESNKTVVTVTVRDYISALSGKNETVKKGQFSALYAGMNGFRYLWIYFDLHLRRKGGLDLLVGNESHPAMSSIASSSPSAQAYGICDLPNVFISTPGLLCTVCPQGYQHTYSYAFLCSKCPNGSSCYDGNMHNNTHTNCNVTCPVGKGYNSSLGFCEWCPYNFYQDISNAKFLQCIACPEQKITPYVGAKNVSDCVDPCGNGTYMVVKTYQPGMCGKCPVNTYMDLTNHDARQCKLCGGGKMTLSNGSASADDCVERCFPGKYLDTNTRQCQPCARNTYQEGHGQTSCIPCTEGKITLTNGTNSSAGCLTPCSNGTYMLVTGLHQGRCIKCPVNTYMDEDKHDVRKCKACPDGKMTLQNGSTSENDCVERCPPGQFLEISKRICKPCAKNFYQDKHGQISCVPCPESHMTLYNGTDNSTKCIHTCSRGSIATSLGPPVNCTKCPQGTYQDILGATHCKKCPSGKGTLYEGTQNASNCVTPCSYGAHMDLTSPGNCIECPLGAFQDKNVSFGGSCTKCPDPKTTTFRLGARNASECVEYCSSSPCLHGGRCENLNGTFRCECTRGLAGKRCEEILDQHVAENMTISIAFTSLVWQDALTNPSSDHFQGTASKIEASIQTVMKNDPNFRTAKVREMKQGSVVATIDVTMVVENSTVRPLEALDEAVKTGQIGELAVRNDSLSLLSYSCGQPIGMEDRRIADDQISASTYKDFNGSRPWDGRLQSSGPASDKSWESIVIDANQWLQVDFRSTMRITAVATQGKKFTRYVKNYTLAFSDDGVTWSTYQDLPGTDKVFTGNTEPYNAVKNTLPIPRVARYLRLHPRSWKDDISMKMEVYGCIPPPPPTTVPPPVTSSPVTSSPVTSSPVTSWTVTSPTQSSPAKGGLSSGAVVAIVLVCIVVVLVTVAVVCICLKKRHNAKRERGGGQAIRPTNPADFQNPTYDDAFELDDKEKLNTHL